MEDRLVDAGAAAIAVTWVEMSEFVSGARTIGLPLISAAGRASGASCFCEHAARSSVAQKQAKGRRRVMGIRIVGGAGDSRNWNGAGDDASDLGRSQRL